MFQRHGIGLIVSPRDSIGLLVPVAKVRNYFPGHGWFEGTIAAFDGVYHVRYEDNDEEEY